MGQYHKVYNVDKQEFLHAHDLSNGLKLMEQVGHEKSTATALFLLLANSNGRGGGDAVPHEFIGRWAGDRIVIQGDYVDVSDQGFLSEEEIENYENISDKVFDMLKLQFEE